MKSLFLFTLTIVLSLNLSARENPFAMNNPFEDESGQMIEPNERASTPEELQEMQYIKQMQQKMSNANKSNAEAQTSKEMKPVDKTYSKQEVDSLIQKTKNQTEQKTKEIVKKELANSKTTEPEQVVYVKPRADVAENDTMVSKTILPFLKIEYSDNKIIIHTQYEVSKKFDIAKENKIAIDYKAKLNFNTKVADIDSKNFKKIALGNHSDEGFFRVAIELANKPSSYNISYKNNLITISKLN